MLSSCSFVFCSGEREGPLHFLDSSKAPTPASRYGTCYPLSYAGPYSGSHTPSSIHSYPFEMLQMESLREKLARLTREKGSTSVCVFSICRDSNADQLDACCSMSLDLLLVSFIEQCLIHVFFHSIFS